MSNEIPGPLLLDRDVIQNPYPFYDRLREQNPVWNVPGTDVYTVSSFALLSEAAKRTQDFSSNMFHVLYRDGDGLPGRLPFGGTTLQTLATADPPVHNLHKMAVFPEFIGKRMTELEPEVVTVAAECLKRSLANGCADVQMGLANLVPITMISRLVGFRDADLQRLMQAAFDSTELLGATQPHVDAMFPAIEMSMRPLYLQMNQTLKAHAEAFEKEPMPLHPAVDEGVAIGEASRTSMLRCHCASAPVEVRIDEMVLHNHLCGCTQCWKPPGALFAQTAVVPSGSLRVTANEKKLVVVDASKSIRRHACCECGVHMFGRVEDTGHHFYGLEFLHPELAVEGRAPAPEFAGFISSTIETAASPSSMVAVRKRLAQLGIPAYDAFSPELMDIIAWHRVKIARELALSIPLQNGSGSIPPHG